MKIDDLRCPACHSDLEQQGDVLKCRNGACGAVYPIVDGVAVLINEKNSVFRLADFTERRATFYQPKSASRFKRFLVSLIPEWGANLKAADNFARLAALLRERPGRPRVLVVGGSVFNRGMEPLLDDAFDLIETDVAFGERTQLIVDAHDIPFDDGSMDAVVAQAVLEHVLDPWRCVEEFHRVLKPDGLVYAETPFMQQVHAGAYDFTRFTHLGHRWLFRRFEEIDSGAVSGPGVALASAYCHFLTSFATWRPLRSALLAMAQFTAFWCKWFDRRLIKKPGAYDAAFGYYFLGKRSSKTLDARELTGQYRGGTSLLKPR